jgi:hypothetical protein
LPLEFFDPPASIMATGSKLGIDIGGSKSILSIDTHHNLYNEGNIFVELSWAAFYNEEGLEDQIDTFETKEYDSVREDPEALVETITSVIYNIINNKKLFYGIADFEVDGFLSQEIAIPGINLDYSLINKLLNFHKKTREKE